MIYEGARSIDSYANILPITEFNWPEPYQYAMPGAGEVLELLPLVGPAWGSSEDWVTVARNGG